MTGATTPVSTQRESELVGHTIIRGATPDVPVVRRRLGWQVAEDFADEGVTGLHEGLPLGKVPHRADEARAEAPFAIASFSALDVELGGGECEDPQRKRGASWRSIW